MILLIEKYLMTAGTSLPETRQTEGKEIFHDFREKAVKETIFH